MIRRTIILIMAMTMTITSKAGDVTPEQALQQAQAFVENVKGKKLKNVGSRRAVSASSLRLEGRVDGLYVFNMEENGGYVIVSDDDRTTPVLGYADSGHLDLDNMPENMKAWLEGYANEIAWIRTNNIQPAVNAASRRASVVKKPVAPLLLSRWSQNFPYNYLCPEYMPGYKAAVGCVALAMAQCMYATEMRVGSTTTYTTAEIPAYKTQTRGISIDGIPAGTPINWSKMIGDYSGDYTGEQAMAVAELTYYCGVAIKMDYAMDDEGNSGSYLNYIPDALVKYFDYSPTAKYLNRTFYSYQDWIDIMYNELSQGRPIAYSGYTETASGHGFVCDGYWNEDYFHINWGWAGGPNGYFKLSVLDPYSERGTSNIPSDFGAGHAAVIGIQKNGETGTVQEIPPHHVVNLSGKFKSYSDHPTQGQNVDVFFEVLNNSSDEIDGTFFLKAYYGQTEESVYSKRVVIPAKESRVCQLSFVPKHSGKYFLRIFYDIGKEIIFLAASPAFDVADGIELPTTANVELGHTLTIENVTTLYNAEKNDYDIYGNTFRGKLTVTNPDPTTNFRGYYICSMKRTKPAAKEVFVFFREIVIPAGGSFDIPIEFTGMTHKDRYSLTVTYLTENGWHAEETIALFYKQPTIVTTMPDGTEIDVIPQLLDPEGTYTVPAQAVSVDLRATGITTLNTKGCTPNTLYLFNTTDEVPDGLTNIVRFDTDSRQYTADDIRLTDGYSFASPVDLTANNIAFTYNPDRWADEKGVWNTLIVPFNVTSVTADGQPIDWFRSSSDEGKQFWLKEFSGDDPDIVYFDDVASSMTANTPYLIALPGNHWGADYDLSKQTIKFIGSGEIQKSTSETLTASSYIYMGNTAQNNIENIYTLNAAGTQFELSNGNAPFRAYFKPITFDPRITALSISSNELNVPVREVENNVPSTDIWYTIDGRQLSGKPATKGIYIVDGKKVMVK